MINKTLLDILNNRELGLLPKSDKKTVRVNLSKKQIKERIVATQTKIKKDRGDDDLCAGVRL